MPSRSETPTRKLCSTTSAHSISRSTTGPGRGRVDVHGQAALAPLAGGHGVGRRAHGLALGRLDLDDVRAQVGQHLGGQRSGHEGREVEHPHAGQQRSTGGPGRGRRPVRWRGDGRGVRRSGRTEMGEPTTRTSRWVPSARARARPVSAEVRVGQHLARAPAPARRPPRPRGAAGSSSSRGRVAKVSTPAHGPGVEQPVGLVGVVALLAGLVAEHLDERGVHALAAEPDLDELVVGAAVQEVREGGALLPVGLDLGRRPLGPPDHAAERGEHPVVERGLAPAARAGRGPLAEQGQHRGGEQEGRAPPPVRRVVEEDRAGAVAGQLGAEARTGPPPAGRSRPSVAGGVPARAAPGVDQPGVGGAQVARSRGRGPRPAPRARRPAPRPPRRAARATSAASSVATTLLVAVPGPTPGDVRRRSACVAVPTTRTTRGPQVGQDHAGHARRPGPRPRSLVPTATSTTDSPAHGRPSPGAVSRGAVTGRPAGGGPPRPPARPPRACRRARPAR